MKLINVDQNSKEWRAWRDKGIGASVAATVMGINPYGSKFELWCELTGLCERAPFNEFAAAAMKRGQELEPLAREKFEQEMGGKWPSICAEHDEHSFIRASPDGYCGTLGGFAQTLIEIKCPGKEAHSKAIIASEKKDGKLIPKHYYAQMQHQFLVTGAVKGWYVSWDGKSEKVVHVEVFPDAAYIETLKAALIHFWGLVTMQIAPPVEPKDLKAISSRINDAMKRLTQANKALAIYMESV